jgi:regulator of RNase E activity RraA
MVIDYNVPVKCGGVRVSPGDLIVADFDGVLAVPASAVEEAVRRATDKVSRENSSRMELMQGAYLRDVYNKYGVL